MKNWVSAFSLVYYACKAALVITLFQWWLSGGDVAGLLSF